MGFPNEEMTVGDRVVFDQGDCVNAGTVIAIDLDKGQFCYNVEYDDGLTEYAQRVDLKFLR